jgi:hypothetical protein
MPRMTRVAALLALAASVAAIAGCGSNDINGTIPQANADQMVAELDAVETSLASGDCSGAQARVQGFLNQVDLLPSTAGSELKGALRDSGNNLKSLVAQCQSGVTGPTGEQSTSQHPSTKHTTTDTTTADTSTSEETTTTPEEPASPPANSNAGGNGNGNANGQGNGTSGGNPGNGNAGGGGSTGGTGGTGIGGD